MLTKQGLSVALSLILVTLFASFLWFQNIEDTHNDVEINRHIELINLSNEISSYAKRAEGHLLLFLLLNDEIDRNKFFSRVDSLTGLISQVLTKELNADELKIVHKITSQSNQILSIGNQLIAESVSRKTNKKSDDFNELVLLFHKSTSGIRHQGIELVKISTAHIDEIQSDDIKNTKLKSDLLAVGMVLTFMFVLIYTRQITKLAVSEKQTTEYLDISNTDGLTGIGNRRYFDNELKKQWRRSQRDGDAFYLLILDIDFFKNYNDSYGHIQGDRCLKIVADALVKSVHRPMDTVFRFGGEEFAIILNDTTDGISVAEQCRKNIEELSIEHNNSSISKVVTLSIGVGKVTGKADLNMEDCLERVDNALYRAKGLGKNQVVLV
ncbi:MAG: hypothetical protein DIZ80_04675 [endosymbiont of Galathealinum brachiosum]|uniref:diguanylate cyclase n=1 Tax=endosymbiont of Galathealinum brachiosum TaxID=2200906 RepID=A0A370DKT3_9GAMM|nr:MAG: hypothetical protein DIZ80_04675 [endosymbiont of Galathealinum brachiosum]